jgi:hypothetical protein
LQVFSGGCKFAGQKPTMEGRCFGQSGKTIDTTEKACQLQTHSLFDLFSDKEKKFYHNGYWCQCKKLFFFVKDVGTE